MIFYTDGSAHPNPGPGGFGVVVLNESNNIIATHSDFKPSTTNNEMEMYAILWACCYAKTHNNKDITIYSDSAYAINTFTNWMYPWEKNGWIKKDGSVPKNLHLIKAFFELNKVLNIKFEKVKGHNGIVNNELADKLAKGLG